jgi:hypothetical protein
MPPPDPRFHAHTPVYAASAFFHLPDVAMNFFSSYATLSPAPLTPPVFATLRYAWRAVLLPLSLPPVSLSASLHARLPFRQIDFHYFQPASFSFHIFRYFLRLVVHCH